MGGAVAAVVEVCVWGGGGSAPPSRPTEMKRVSTPLPANWSIVKTKSSGESGGANWYSGDACRPSSYTKTCREPPE